MPGTSSINKLHQELESEQVTLYLPSLLPIKFQSLTWFNDLKKIELDLRKGEAADAIDELRMSLQRKEILQAGRAEMATGNDSITCAQASIDRAHRHVLFQKDQYMNARSSMLHLGETFSVINKAFPTIQPIDLVTKSLTGFKKLGDGRNSNSWIWTHGVRGILSEQEEFNYIEDGMVTVLV